MSLLNLVQGQRVYTQQIQHDLSTSNVMINCDPRLKGPKGSVLDVKSKAGKVARKDTTMPVLHLAEIVAFAFGHYPDRFAQLRTRALVIGG